MRLAGVLLLAVAMGLYALTYSHGAFPFWLCLGIGVVGCACIDAARTPPRPPDLTIDMRHTIRRRRWWE